MERWIEVEYVQRQKDVEVVTVPGVFRGRAIEIKFDALVLETTHDPAAPQRYSVQLSAIVAIAPRGVMTTASLPQLV